MGGRYRHEELIAATEALYVAAGLAEPVARAVAEILVEADMMGYSTHGLQFVPAYLAGIEAGTTRTDGEPEIISDRGSVVLLDAKRLPGQWAMLRALDLAQARLGVHPVVCVAMRRAGNISCLATYVRRAALEGAFALLTASAPGNAVVAPHGGRAPRYSTNPFAYAVPAPAHPILVDTSASSTTNRAIERARRIGIDLEGHWLVDASGHDSADPETIYTDPPGAIQPLGGAALGHKGFAFGILVEALTSGLAGQGRASGEGSGNTVFLQLIDPAAFGGLAGLENEMAALGQLCRDTPPRSGFDHVRMPGDKADALYNDCLDRGVRLHPDIPPRLIPCFEKYGIPMPQTL